MIFSSPAVKSLRSRSLNFMGSLTFSNLRYSCGHSCGKKRPIITQHLAQPRSPHPPIPPPPPPTTSTIPPPPPPHHSPLPHPHPTIPPSPTPPPIPPPPPSPTPPPPPPPPINDIQFPSSKQSQVEVEFMGSLTFSNLRYSYGHSCGKNLLLSINTWRNPDSPIPHLHPPTPHPHRHHSHLPPPPPPPFPPPPTLNPTPPHPTHSPTPPHSHHPTPPTPNPIPPLPHPTSTPPPSFPHSAPWSRNSRSLSVGCGSKWAWTPEAAVRGTEAACLWPDAGAGSTRRVRFKSSLILQVLISSWDFRRLASSAPPFCAWLRASSSCFSNIDMII